LIDRESARLRGGDHPAVVAVAADDYRCSHAVSVSE
jgi:hypothetical protein